MSRHAEKRRAEALVKALTGLSTAQGLYPSGHAAVERAQKALVAPLREALGGATSLLVGHDDDALVVGEVPFFGDHPHGQPLRRLLKVRGVEGFILEADAEAREVARFLEWLKQPEADPWQGRAVNVTRLQRDRGIWGRATQLYRTALDAIEDAYREVGDGGAVEPRAARESVRALSDLLAESPQVLQGLVLIKDYDRYTFHHSVNVCLLALGLGRHEGLGVSELECMGLGGLLHDIGKTRTPPEIIRKAGKLSKEEWALIWLHPGHGRDILEEMGGVPDPTPQLVYEHHMRFDGGGYPARVNGYRVSPLSPLITVADTYDAMTSHRPYSAPLSLPEAVKTLEKLRGSLLDPQAVDTFLEVFGRLPVGSVVRLASGEVAVVSEGEDAAGDLGVRVVRDSGGKLLERGDTREVPKGEIVHWVDPLSSGIDPAAVLRNEP